MRRIIAFLLFGLALLVAAPLIAQDQGPANEEEQKSFFLRFVQDRLSTPERQIRISNIDGVLSENASIDEITISDAEGVYARILNAAINWNQGALLGGRLEIRSLTADSIEYLRNPVPSGTALPSPEAGGLEIPQLPVAVILDELSIPSITFGEQVFGLGSQISVSGGFVLEGGSLDANLDITRLDGPGGTLAADVVYTNETQNIDVDVTLTEPPNGIIANLLNIEGRPEVALAVAGSGPVSALQTELTLDAGGRRALTGLAEITQAPEGFIVDADLRGPIAELVAEPYRAFFGTETALTANALVRSAGGLSINELRLSGGQLSLQASAETTPDNFLRTLQLNATVADTTGALVTLPVPGNATRVQEAQVIVDYGRGGTEDWTGSLVVNGFETSDFSATTLALNASGVAANLDNPTERRLTFNGDGGLSGIRAESEEVQAALGESIGFGLAGLWNAGEPVELAEFRLSGPALTLAASGEIANNILDGDISLVTSSIAPFSGVAGRELNGAIDVTAQGTIDPLLGAFNLTVNGTADDLGIDDATADRLLAGQVRLTGRVARTQAGIEAEQFTIANEQVQIVADGNFASDTADFNFRLDLSDLELVSAQASGALSVVGTARGTEGVIALNLDAQVPAGALADRPLQDANVAFVGRLTAGNLDGNIDGSAFLDGFRVSLASAIAADADQRRLSGLTFEAGGTTVNGDLTQNAQGLFEGELRLASANITTAAALLLTEASGAANATIALSNTNGEQQAVIEADVSDLRVADARVGSAQMRASIEDLFGVPVIDGAATASDVVAAGIEVAALDARATRTGQTTDFDATADLANGTKVALAGNLTPLDQGYRLGVQTASLTQGELSARLLQPAALTVSGSSVTMDDVQFDVGGGRVTATGTAGEALDIALTIDALSLSIANAIQPDLQLSGTINGTAAISGSADNPRAQFQVTGSGLDAAAIAAIGISPMSLTASGSFADNTIQLAEMRANGAGGLSVSGSGTIPLAGSGLSVTANGSVPLGLVNRFVSDRGGQASGTLNLNAQVTGSLAAPRFAGEVSTSGAEYVDPETNLRLNNITGTAQLDGDRISTSSLRATLATGGSISVSGSVGLQAPAFPVDLAIRLAAARYADGNLLVATLSGDLALRGELGRSPVLSGNVFVEKADITVPERFGGSSTLIDVDHVAIPPAAAQTLARARAEGQAPTPRTRPSILQLDVNVAAPNQIFVRGRGLDAELGGSVRLTGPVTSIQPVGGFELIRGRLAILGQRVTLESGTLTMVGDLDPFINLVARTEGDDITVFVTLSGRVSEVDVTFTSSPELPQDEVLSRLIFNRSMGELSPLQIARLAGAAAELAGGSNTSLVDSLRQSTGLDDLDIVTDAQGNVAVQAGRYIQDNVYLGVQAGANGQSRATINLDITEDLKARGSVGADGNSDVGIFFERDY